MQRRSRHKDRPGSVLAALVLLGGLAALAAACSSSPSGRTVASLPGTTTTTTGGTNSVSASSGGSYDQDVVDYTHCLRAHGVHEPDPVNETHNGKTGLSFVMPQASAANKSGTGGLQPLHRQAVGHQRSRCEPRAARGSRPWSGTRPCMRSHDIGMLDPGPQGQLNLGNVPGISSDFGRYSPQFRTADAACRHLLPAGVHDDGTGP